MCNSFCTLGTFSCSTWDKDDVATSPCLGPLAELGEIEMGILEGYCEGEFWSSCDAENVPDGISALKRWQKTVEDFRKEPLIFLSTLDISVLEALLPFGCAFLVAIEHSLEIVLSENSSRGPACGLRWRLRF